MNKLLAKIFCIDPNGRWKTRPVREYLELLGQARYFERESRGNGNVYYKNTRRCMLFYDKTREYHDKRLMNFVPETFAGKHVLRYVLRYLKNIANQFKSEIIGKDLYNENF